jgi:hypothetical protein
MDDHNRQAVRALPGVANSLDLADVKLGIELNPAAPAALQEIGIAYWDLAGIDPETGDPVWTHRTTGLGYKAWSGTAHYAAAAAVTATASDYACAACEGELTLTSRQALTDARREKPVKCRACNAVTDEHAAKVLNPKSLEKRARQVAEAGAREKAAESARELERARREAIAACYTVEAQVAEDVIASASLLARIGALVILRAAGNKEGLIHPVDLDNSTIGPNRSLSRDLFIAALSRPGARAYCRSTRARRPTPSCGNPGRRSGMASTPAGHGSSSLAMALSGSALRASPAPSATGSPWHRFGQRSALNWPS